MTSPLPPSFPPAFPAATPPVDRDAQHLKTLAILHFVLGGMGVCGLGFIVVHFFMMQMLMNSPPGSSSGTPRSSPPPEEFMLIMQGIYVVGAVLGVLFIVLNILSGLYMLKWRRRTFSMVVSAMNCLQMPLGTALGVFTIIVLMRDSVRLKYATTRAPAIYPS